MLPRDGAANPFLNFDSLLVEQLAADTVRAYHYVLSRVAGLQQMGGRSLSR